MSEPDAGSGELNTLDVGTAGPRVAFLHGLFGQGRNWTQVAKTLAGADGSGARSLLVDLPDHGRSPWTAQFSYEDYARRVAATLAAAGPGERWVLVGHSLGGKTAMVTTLLHPDLVRHLVVVGDPAHHDGRLRPGAGGGDAGAGGRYAGARAAARA